MELSNPSEFARLSEPVFTRYYDLGMTADDPRVPSLTLLEGSEPQTAHALQPVDENADGTLDGVLALVDFDPREIKNFTFISRPGTSAPSLKLTQAEISVKAGGQWKPRQGDPKLSEYVGGTFQNVLTFTPPPQHTDHSNLIRYEGPGIESDKVAYRIYLDERNGFDVFGKKVPTPVLQDIGKDGYESYHHMSGWGMDILKVGLSLGAGGFGFYNAKSKQVELVSKVSGWDATIIANGNLQSSFRIAYKDWKVAKKTVQLLADFSMTGGSRLVHTKLRASEELPNIAVGLVKHEGVEVLEGPTEVTGSAFTYLATWGKQSLAEDLLGMAVLYRRGQVQSRADDGVNVAVALDVPGSQVDYYFAAAWQGESNGLDSKEAFVTYLEQEIEKLTLTPRRRLSTSLTDRALTPVTAETALAWSRKLADSELVRKTLEYRHDGWDAHRQRKPKFEYDIVGLQPLAYDELNELSPDPRYAEVARVVPGSYVTDTGKILEYEQKEYNLDAINPGRNLLRLYAATKENKYKLAAAQLRKQLEKQPRTSGGAFWHKKKYPSQLWLDGVYMAVPFLTRYSQMFEDGRSYPEVLNEFTLTREHLRDSQTGLYYHAWDESKKQGWADPQTGLSPQFWGRGMGWFSMALVDVLELLPEERTELRKPLLDMTTELAASVARVQDETGTWWQIVDKPGAVGNYRESSASAMFTYFYAKATRLGYLDSSYAEVAKRGYEGLLNEFILVHPDGKISMTNQCLVGGLGYGRDGSYRYYMSEPIASNDPKGNGPFILAGVEMARLLGADASTAAPGVAPTTPRDVSREGGAVSARVPNASTF